MTNHIKLRNLPGTWCVRAGGAVLGETTQALELSEGEHPEVIYFPREDIAMAFLDQTAKTSHCPHKGDATYFSVVTKSTTLDNIAWSYEAPIAGMERIKDHLAFYTSDHVAVEEL